MLVYKYSCNICRKCNGQAFKQTSVFRVSDLLTNSSVDLGLFLFLGAKGPESGSRELTPEREGRKVLELVKHDYF